LPHQRNPSFPPKHFPPFYYTLSCTHPFHKIHPCYSSHSFANTSRASSVPYLFFDRVLARSIPSATNQTKKTMSAHSSKFNASDGGRGRGRGRGGGRGRGSGGTTNKNTRRIADEELEGKLGFELFTEGEPRLGWLLTLASVSYLASTIFFLTHQLLY
jgi:hypothetical protein